MSSNGTPQNGATAPQAAPASTGPKVTINELPPKRPIRLWMVLTGLLVLAILVLTVPIIQGLRTETIGALNPTMKLWFEVNSAVVSFLMTLLLVILLKEKELTKLWQLLVALMAFNGLILATLLADVRIAGVPMASINRGSWACGIAFFILLILLVVAWQRKVAAKYKSSELSEIKLFSYPKFVYLWLVIALGYIFDWPIGYHQWASENALGWWYLATMMTVFLTTCVDLNRVASLLWLSLIAIITLGYFLVSVTVGETFLDSIGRFFAGLTPPYPTEWALAFSVVASIPFVIMVIGVRINDKWLISHNKFEHRTLFGKDDSLARGAKRVKASYPDLLELLLLGSGTLTIYSAQGTGTIVLAEIRNIPFLILRMGRIDRILESMQVDTTADEEAGESESSEEK
jgi:hypothetical protein